MFAVYIGSNLAEKIWSLVSILEVKYQTDKFKYIYTNYKLVSQHDQAV